MNSVLMWVGFAVLDQQAKFRLIASQDNMGTQSVLSPSLGTQTLVAGTI